LPAPPVFTFGYSPPAEHLSEPLQSLWLMDYRSFKRIWSLDNTIFKTVAALTALATNAAHDHVQVQAVRAFEALASSLVVATERIEEGLGALNSNGRSERLDRLKLLVGLSPGGIAFLIRKQAPQCVTAFLLAVSRKTRLNDHEIGNVLHGMVVYQGLYQNPEFRVSRLQLGELISAISGFGDSITAQDL
jgi:hypothetical protein